MKLAVYLTERGISDADFGAKIGRSRSSVSRLRRGETQPDWVTAAKIMSETNGAVTPNDFLPEPPAQQTSQIPFPEPAQ
jgi:transcriptional regulator with XRE-family HTH domain